MAKPVDTYIQTPTDSGNTGKQVRTQSRVIGGQTVHEHFFVRSAKRTIEGVYFADPGVMTVQASATNGTTTGFFWIVNPTGATTNTYVRKVKFTHQLSASTAMPTNPRIALAVGTFTGTASGAAISIAKHATADASAQTTVRTASTGLTVTLGNLFFSTLPPVVIGTAGLTISQPFVDTWIVDEAAADDGQGFVVLATGECCINYQPDSGTASDSRKFDVDVEFSEADNT